MVGLGLGELVHASYYLQFLNITTDLVHVDLDAWSCDFYVRKDFCPFVRHLDAWNCDLL